MSLRTSGDLQAGRWLEGGEGCNSEARGVWRAGSGGLGLLGMVVMECVADDCRGKLLKVNEYLGLLLGSD